MTGKRNRPYLGSVANDLLKSGYRKVDPRKNTLKKIDGLYHGQCNRQLEANGYSRLYGIETLQHDVVYCPKCFMVFDL